MIVCLEKNRNGNKQNKNFTKDSNKRRTETGRDTFFSDDEEGAQEFTYQVHVYSKTDYIDILQRLKTALKAAGFYAITIDAETYEQDTGYYHVPVEIK